MEWENGIYPNDKMTFNDKIRNYFNRNYITNKN